MGHQIPEGEKGTALHASAYQGLHKVIEVLLANGADTTAGWKNLVMLHTASA